MARPKSRAVALRQRHAEAKFQRELYVQRFGEEKVPKYSSFLRNTTPLEEQLVVYDVSFQVSYRGNKDDLLISPVTFKVVGFKTQEQQIRDRTMNLILDSKGSTSKVGFRPNTLKAVEGATQVDVKPRGMEESTANLSKADLRKVAEDRFLVKELDNKVEFSNKKGRKGSMDLDIRHFT